MLIFSVTAALLGAVSVLNFIMYGIDKASAKRHGRRIPERVLLALSLLGGGAGGSVGMLLFRHKTRHAHFAVLNILGVLLQAALLVTLAVFGL